ncbi:UNVERIFIED_CONTAM: hypothetical protein H355_004446 [Colinus virginianus]|nr:hypothetical protein H355_004446 [Colinus virginianus]
MWDAAPPCDTPEVHYFCTDDKFVYEPFFADFGPLNLSCVCKYARMLDGKLAAARKQNRIVVHYAPDHSEKRANAVLLMGAAQQLLLGRSAQEAFRPFRALLPRLATYRDASCGPCSFSLSVLDCLEGLEMAIKLGWFNYKTFDVEAYDFYEKVENGDLNWVIPKKFIAFSCPSAASSGASVMRGQREATSCCTPEYYVQIFKRFGVKLVVCLSNRLYDAKKFTRRSIDHADLFFVDGTCPSSGRLCASRYELQKLTIEERLIAENGDAQQGERLFMAKRQRWSVTLLRETLNNRDMDAPVGSCSRETLRSEDDERV